MIIEPSSNNSNDSIVSSYVYTFWSRRNSNCLQQFRSSSNRYLGKLSKIKTEEINSSIFVIFCWFFAEMRFLPDDFTSGNSKINKFRKTPRCCRTLTYTSRWLYAGLARFRFPAHSRKIRLVTVLTVLRVISSVRTARLQQKMTGREKLGRVACPYWASALFYVIKWPF